MITPKLCAGDNTTAALSGTRKPRTWGPPDGHCTLCPRHRYVTADSKYHFTKYSVSDTACKWQQATFHRAHNSWLRICKMPSRNGSRTHEYQRRPYCMRCGVYATLRCLSVCPSVCLSRRHLPQPGRVQRSGGFTLGPRSTGPSISWLGPQI